MPLSVKTGIHIMEYDRILQILEYLMASLAGFMRSVVQNATVSPHSQFPSDSGLETSNQVT